MAEVYTYTKAKIEELLSSHQHLGAAITDLDEVVQDIVGAMFVAMGGAYNDTTRAVTLPTANETKNGIVEMATAAETIAGTDTTRAVHPAGLASAISNRPASSTVTVVWTGTQAAYDAITTKEPATLYFIKG